MIECPISAHCFFEKSVLLCNIRVVVHYLPFYPVIEVSLEYNRSFNIVLFSGKFLYKSDSAYDSYLAFLLGDEDSEEDLLH